VPYAEVMLATGVQIHTAQMLLHTFVHISVCRQHLVSKKLVMWVWCAVLLLTVHSILLLQVCRVLAASLQDLLLLFAAIDWIYSVVGLQGASFSHFKSLCI